MIQFADKTLKQWDRDYLTDKQKKVLDIYFNNGEKDIDKAVTSSGYIGNKQKTFGRNILNKKSAKAYLDTLRTSQVPHIDVFTRVNAIASNTELRPEVQLDALQLLDKLSDKRSNSLVSDVKTPVPVSGKDRINWLIEQLRACGSAGKQALALADNDIKSILAAEVKK